MKNQTLKIVNITLNVVGAGMLVSSFFVKDNTKAVKRRWQSVGVLGIAWGLRIIDGAVAMKSKG